MSTDKQWVVIPGVIGWVREHNPETESGIAPIGKYREQRDTQQSNSAGN